MNLLRRGMLQAGRAGERCSVVRGVFGRGRISPEGGAGWVYGCDGRQAGGLVMTEGGILRIDVPALRKGKRRFLAGTAA